MNVMLAVTITVPLYNILNFGLVKICSQYDGEPIKKNVVQAVVWLIGGFSCKEHVHHGGSIRLPFRGNVFPAFNFSANLLKTDGKVTMFVFPRVASFGVEIEN
jgi:hypothetical protein